MKNYKKNFFLQYFSILLAILSSLNGDFKKKFFILILVVLLTTIAEIFSIGLIFPIFDVFVQETQSKYFKFFNFVNFNLQKDLILIYFLIFFILLFCIKNFLIIYSINYINKFFHELEAAISVNILKNYTINNDDKIHENKFSTLFKNARIEVIHFCDIIKSQIVIIKEILVLVFLVSLSILIQPIYFMLCFIFILLSGYLFNEFSKNILRQYGEYRVYHENKFFHYLLNFIHGLKEISLFQTQKTFYNKIKHHLDNFNKLLRKKIMFSNSPKYIFEVFGLMFMGFLTFINFIYIKSPIEELIPILIFYIIIFYRILPSVSAINSNLVTLNYNQASLKIIKNEILDKSNFFVKKFVLENKNYVSKSLDCIKLVNINFSYKDIEIFKKMNFEIKKNEITLLTGESGKGKSTLIKIILGDVAPHGGEIYFNNNKIENNDIHTFKNNISVVYQEPFIMDDTILNNITLLQDETKVDWKKIKESCQIAEIYDFCNSLPYKFNSVIGEKGEKISGGQKQRIAIARALYFNKSLLILDESTNALDKNTEQKIIKNLFDKKITTLCIAHKVENNFFKENTFIVQNYDIKKSI